MNIISQEIKAYCTDLHRIERLLLDMNAEYIGEDHQIDTYFKVNKGRLKLRQGNIENNLIYYNRPNQKSVKQSEVQLYKVEKDSSVLKEQLSQAMGVLAVVDKKRCIFFIENVKFHLDTVSNLGTFVEIEALGSASENNRLLDQCQHYKEILGISHESLIRVSYSDMVLEKETN